jgi:hypothetical protein
MNMVTIEEIQAAYYMVAATGVLVAAYYYIQNMKETAKNRRATLTNNILETFLSEEGMAKFLELLSMEWGDFDDFAKKYDSRVNPKNFALRMSLWNVCDLIGYQYREGILDLSSIYNVGGIVIDNIWEKFGPIIKEYRKRDYATDHFENFEYLAGVLSKMKESKDADYKGKKLRLLVEHQK